MPRRLWRLDGGNRIHLSRTIILSCLSYSYGLWTQVLFNAKQCRWGKDLLASWNPAAVGSVEGWRVGRKRERSFQCWLRQEPAQTRPWRLFQWAQREPNGGADSEVSVELRGASAWLCPLQTLTAILSATSHPQAHAAPRQDNSTPSSSPGCLPVLQEPGEGEDSLRLHKFFTCITLFCLNHLNIQKVAFGERLA